tara:strand:+ start:189 stop:575 length:387 start_codon:yes stop_codon:yes gene_type:complete
MATVQITWVDASTNETKFNVYRSDDNASSVTTDANHLIATVEYDGTATGADWANSKWPNIITTGNSSIDANGTFQLTSGNSNANTDAAQTYVATYTDNTTGTFKWAVTAENNIGASAAEETATGLAIN